MKKRITLYFFSLFTVLCAIISCSGTKSTVAKTITTNSKEAIDKPYVILISLDGFRWDYVDTYKPKYLSSFIENGVKAASLIPSFPSKTFPNHYTIATGMYPDKHGLIANTFYSYDKDETYRIRDREKVVDGSFYNGTPIWVQANTAGMVTASYFFVGTEANIQGIHPTYYYNYDGNVKNESRVQQALHWLAMPEEKRPHLITLYFSDMDDTGHRYGPNNNEEINKSLVELDAVLGNLFEGIEKTGLPITTIIVSDHGMFELPIDKLIPTEQVENDSMYTAIDDGVIVSIHPNNIVDVDLIYKNLQKKENHFKVYKTASTPYFEYTPENRNWGPLQIIADKGYYFSSAAAIKIRKIAKQEVFGVHGFDPALKEMHGIFYAKGPSLKRGYTHQSIKNIHVYPLMCELLGLNIPKDIDGDLNVIKGVLKSELNLMVYL